MIEVIYSLECKVPVCPPPKEIDGFLLKESKQKFIRTEIPESFDEVEYDEDSNPIYEESHITFIKKRMGQMYEWVLVHEQGLCNIHNRRLLLLP